MTLSLVRLGLLLMLAGVLAPTSGAAQERLVPTPAAIAVPDSVRVISGYQHWRFMGQGAAVGAAVGALAGVILSRAPCSDCDRHSTGEGLVLGGLTGAGLGGVVGFLAGLASPTYRWIPGAAPSANGPDTSSRAHEGSTP